MPDPGPRRPLTDAEMDRLADAVDKMLRRLQAAKDAPVKKVRKKRG